MTDTKTKPTRAELQDAAERVRIARTMAAAFPNAGNRQALAEAVEAFNRLRQEDQP